MAQLVSGPLRDALAIIILLAFTVTIAVVLAVKAPELAAAIAIGIGVFLLLMGIQQAKGGRLAAFTLLLALLGATVTSTASASIIPLQWHDSGEELLPGTIATIQVHTEGCVSCGGLADAGFMIESKKFGITQQGRTVYIFFEGHPHEIGKLPWLKRTMYDATFTVKLYCPGEAPPGHSPVNGRLWMEVYAPSHGYRHYYLVNDPGSNGKAPDILYFAESNGVISGSVRVGEVERFSECSYQGDQVSSGSGAGNDGQVPDFLRRIMGGVDKLKMAVAVFVFLLIAPLLISLVQSVVALYKTVKA